VAPRHPGRRRHRYRRPLRRPYIAIHESHRHLAVRSHGDVAEVCGLDSRGALHGSRRAEGSNGAQFPDLSMDHADVGTRGVGCPEGLVPVLAPAPRRADGQIIEINPFIPYAPKISQVLAAARADNDREELTRLICLVPDKQISELVENDPGIKTGGRAKPPHRWVRHTPGPAAVCAVSPKNALFALGGVRCS
jgi:hypothetical protein